MELTFLRSTQLRNLMLNCPKSFIRWTSTQQQQQQQQNDSKLKTQKLSLKTCAPLSTRIPSKKWYFKRIPSDGIQLNVDYIDSSSDGNKPVILCLHSTPGSIYDFKKLITYFGLSSESDYRVVVPQFPGFDFTEKNDCFYHSALERAQFIRDFISQLNINEIECLVVHSSSIYSASYLWMEDDPLNCPIKSLALFNCPGPGVVYKRLWNAFLFNNMMRFNFLKNKLVGGGQWPKISQNDKAHYLLTIYLSDFMTMPQRLEALKQFKIPTLAVVSHHDQLYSQELFYQILHFLGAQIDHFDVYEKHNNKLVQSSHMIDWLKVVNIQGGDNQCFISHSFIVHKYLQDLLNGIKDNQSEQKLLTNLN